MDDAIDDVASEVACPVAPILYKQTDHCCNFLSAKQHLHLQKEAN